MNSHLKRQPLIKIIYLSLFLLVHNPSFADNSPLVNYHWGRGFSFPSLNLTLGGYSDISYRINKTGPQTAKLDDFSFFVSWSPHDRIRFFSEVEMESLMTNRRIANFSESFSIERLYVDLLVSDSLTFRLGQFLTPVGYWNVIHISPLTWTTMQPLVTNENFFPSRINGIMFSKQWIINQHDLDISIYADDSKNLNVRQLTPQQITPETTFKYALGTSIKYQINHNLTLGFSYLAFTKLTQSQTAVNHLVGLDFLWQNKGYEIQMEWAYRYAADQQESELGGYIQGVIPLGYNFFTVGRYELLSGRHQPFSINFKGTVQLGVFALVWRPVSPLVFKTEYRFGNNNQQLAPNGFFSSIAVLF